MSGVSKLSLFDLPVGKLGDVYAGVKIIEANRATKWETRAANVISLTIIRDLNYRSREVLAVVYGVQSKKVLSKNKVKYAVFVQEGFIRETDDDD